MPIITNPLDLPFRDLFFETKSVVPCEPLSDVIARHNPAPVDASERPSKSNGHDRHIAAGAASGGC
jgi:hypothetical protein